ncbi:MAG: hypothetical protein O3C28_09635 [Proteobacteria bacterium]|nr:hypothetical protein [Pseudomonadota bacterium]
MLEINFSGPRALLSNDHNVTLLLADPNAWKPGIYLWTFLFNQVHRINYVGVASSNIAAKHNEHFVEFLSGKRKFYESRELSEGLLKPAYLPGDSHEMFVALIEPLMQQLSLIRIFFAPYDGTNSECQRLADGIISHLHALGGRAAQWLDNDVPKLSEVFEEKIVVRLGRPAFIASLPDEMRL